MLLVWLVLVAAASASWPRLSAPCEDNGESGLIIDPPGICRSKADYKYVVLNNTADVLECAQMCCEDPDCLHFAVHYSYTGWGCPPNTPKCCLLKGSDGITDSGEQNCVSGGKPAPPPRPVEPGTCRDDSDCQLNGVCVSGKCMCDPTWTGPNCEQLNLLPVPGSPDMPNTGAYWPKLSTWGGDVIQDEQGQYHMLVSEVTGHCGINNWLPASQVVHAVSKSPLGPYSRVEAILPPFSFKPQIIKIEGGPYIIMYVGDWVFELNVTCCCGGANGNGTSQDCTIKTPTDRCLPGDPPDLLPPRIPLPPNNQHRLYYADTLDGPWNLLEFYMDGYWNDPSPLVVQNSSSPSGYTIWVALTSDMYYASDWRGPYEPAGVGWYFGDEDPFLYQDKRGNWHTLSHDSDTGGGHSFSTDGIYWKKSTVPAYTTTVQYQNGAWVTYFARERPKLVFDDDGTPVGLITGVLNIFNPAGKGVPPPVPGNSDRSYTHIQPLNH